MNNPFHRFLIKHRVYCEHPGCLDKLTPAVKVIERYGHKIVVCQWHSYGPIEQGLRTVSRLRPRA